MELAGKLLGGAGAKLAARAGASALKAIPGVGLIATAGMAAFDAIKGWNNAGQITGKKQKDLTFRDKAQSATASALSGLTFGLVSTKTMYKGINAVTTGIGKAGKFLTSGIKGAWNWLTKPGKKGEQSGLQKIGNIGSTLFKMTPMGFLASKLFGSSNPSIQKRRLFNLRTISPAIASGINHSAFGKLFAKYASMNKAALDKSGQNSQLMMNGFGMMYDSGAYSMNKLGESVDKMNNIEEQKFEANANVVYEKQKQKKQNKTAEQKKLLVFPQIIRQGIASYFNHLKFQNGRFIQTGDELYQSEFESWKKNINPK